MRNNMLERLRCAGQSLNDNALRGEIGHLFDRISDYLYLYDLDKGTVFHSVFYFVFIDVCGLSYEDIASRLHVASRTVDRYVRNCNLFAEKLIDREYPLIKELFLS